MDIEAPDNVVEVTARAMTYYLDVSVDCTRRITSVDGALKAIVRRLDNIDLNHRTSKDLAEQCVKVSWTDGWFNSSHKHIVDNNALSFPDFSVLLIY